jgi:hypothetical protein
MTPGAIQTSSRSHAPRGEALRDALLLAGIGLESLLRAAAVRRPPRPVLIGGGLIAAGAVGVLAHLAGADVRGGFAGGQPGLVPGLLQTVSDAAPVSDAASSHRGTVAGPG